jgi:hypothetical protein
LKALYWLVGIVLGIPLIYVVLLYGSSELGGEVVTLDRTEASGEVSQVRIWIVDDGDSSWVEHQDPSAFWITRLAESPNVTLARGGETATYIGQPDPGSHDLYHQLRQEKYSWADQVIAALTGNTSECQGVPVRLTLTN